MKLVFEGIKVADFSWAGVGPMTARYLAEHGATVVRIESHKRLDATRTSSPFTTRPPTVDSGAMFAKFNPDKYGVSIDLQNSNGRKLAWKLIAWADIVMESFSPGTMEKWGLGYEDVEKVKPDIIYLSSSMEGRGGPHSSYAGYGYSGVNLCGFTEISGWPDRAPAAPHGAYTDFVCPRFNALAVMAALDYRRRTGKGQYIEQSQFESAIHFLASPIMDYQINGEIIQRNGNRLAGAAPHGVFPCQGNDNWVAIAIFDNEQWQKFCQIVDNPSLFLKDYANLADRKRNEEALEKLVTAWTLMYTAEEITSVLQPAGIPSHKVQKPVDVFSDPQL
jgi:crotonobetainyl-CoA:carnitine CoA-transferase CaiB-like acyl-CoA transferase